MSALPPYSDSPPTQDEGYTPSPANFDTTASKLQQSTTAGHPPLPYQPVTLVGYQPTTVYNSQQYQQQPYPQHSSNNVVVVGQPSPMVMSSMPRPVGDHYLTLSIVMTVLCVLCGHWHSLLCTVPAIVFSIKARDAEQVGDIVTAKSHARVSLILNIVSIVVWVIIGALIGIGVIATIIGVAITANQNSGGYGY